MLTNLRRSIVLQTWHVSMGLGSDGPDQLTSCLIVSGIGYDESFVAGVQP